MSRTETQKTQKKAGTGLVVGALAALSALYLLNPGFGVFDLIPDNLPIIGNLDEAGAAALLISCLAYFGLDLTRLVHLILGIFGAESKPTDATPDPAPTTIDVETK